MSELSEIMQQVSQLVDDEQIGPDLLGDLNAGDVVAEITGLVSDELGSLDDLGDDADENEKILRAHVYTACVKAFFCGLVAGTTEPGNTPLDVPAAPELVEAIALNALRTGVWAVRLVATNEA